MIPENSTESKLARFLSRPELASHHNHTIAIPVIKVVPFSDEEVDVIGVMQKVQTYWSPLIVNVAQLYCFVNQALEMNLSLTDTGRL